MEDKLIGFDTAKLAKEKGFQVKTESNYYNTFGYNETIYGSGKYHDDELGTEWIEPKTGWLLHSRPKDVKDIFCAPTQSLLQKWLRDVHNIIVLPHYTRGENVWNWFVNLEDRINTSEILWHDADLKAGINYDFPTYEEALEAGLVYGLNQIKND